MKDSKSAPVEITKGMTVLYDGCNYTVTAVFKNTVNLGYVWDSRKVYHKGVPKSEVKENHEAFYKAWSQSESYMCM